MTQATNSSDRLDRIEQLLASTAEQTAANATAAAANTQGIQDLRQTIAEEQRLISDLRAQQAGTDARLDRLSVQQAGTDARLDRLSEEVTALTFVVGNFATSTKANQDQQEARLVRQDEMIERLDMLIENLIRRPEQEGSGA